MRKIKNPLTFSRSVLLQQLFVNLLLPAPIITTLTSVTSPSTSNMGLFENVSLTTIEILQNNGYSVEVHNVVTDDGYILELHRIPCSKSGKKPTRNYPVFIHHGILGSSADWVLGGANISLPMQLADAGYDVWLANSRGNTYSRKHVSMTSKQRAFWNFSLHEIGTYDLPASIDYILINTKFKQLHYVGYSMGTCVFYIMASERPEYQPKIRSQISLAPVAYLSNTRSSLKYIAPYAKIINVMYQRFSKGMLMPQSSITKFFASTFCKERYVQKLLCEKCILFSVCGSDPYYFDSNLIPLIMGHFPAGTSAKLAVHFAQFIMKDSFGQYDYGPAENLLHYNSTEPPTYNLKSIQVPISLIYGENDILADVEDVMKLKVQLPKLIKAIPVDSTYCNHVDFLWSLNVTETVNDPVKEILQKTDDVDWEYSGPEPGTVPGIDGRDLTANNNNIYPVVVPPNPKNRLKFAPGLDYVMDNLDAIIASTMPRSVDAVDRAEFEREQERQKILFGNLIKFVKSTENKYGKLKHDFANDMSYWTDDVAADVRNVVETHAKKTSLMINGQVAYAGKSVAYGIAKAENSVVNGVTMAENFVVGGVTKAEHTVVGSIVKAENFVNYGLTKADLAVGNALNTTFKTLSRAFWFLR